LLLLNIFRLITLDVFDYFRQYVHIHTYVTYHYEETMIQYRQVQIVLMWVFFLRNDEN